MLQGTVFLGRYEVRGVLGRGGSAVVCDGWDNRLHRPVAIKVLHPGVFSEPGVRERFEAEALATASLNHPNIVAVHDSGVDDDSPFIVMERLPGGTLADHIAAGPLPLVRVRALLDNILAALSAAHAKQILHRDIKPGNILHTADGDIYKLADFGIAKTSGAAHTVTGQLVGTLAYLSPERLSGAKASVTDDLYAVGVVAYEALTGRDMFGPTDSIGALATSILHDSPPPLHVVRPDVDPQLAAVIQRALTRDPHQRFSDADDMRMALNGERQALPNSLYAGQTRPITKVFPSPLVPPPSTPRRAPSSRTKRVLAAAGLSVVLAVTALAFAMQPSPATSPQPVSESTISTPPTSPTRALPPPPPPAAPVIQQSGNQEGPPAAGRGKGNGKGPKKNR